MLGPDVAVQLGHKALAEPHDLPIGFALGVEVGTAFGTAHGQAGQAVLKVCSDPRNFVMDRLTEGWNRRPLYKALMAELYCTR